MKAAQRSNEKAPDVRTSAGWRQFIPYAASIAIFSVVTILFFSPQLFDGKVLQQSDIVHFRGMAREIVEYREQFQKEPLWTNTMFGGMPAFQISVRYSGNLLRIFDQLMSFGFPHPARLLFMAFVGFYLLLLSLRVHPWLAIAGALAYGLASYNLTLLEAGHNSKMHSLALTPLVVAGILITRKGHLLGGGLLTAISLSLLIRANHLQITYYLMLALLIYGIVETIFSWKEGQIKKWLAAVGVLVIAAAFAALTNLSLLWCTYEYLPSTIRGPAELSINRQSTGGLNRDYAYSWSYGKWETFTLLIPGFKGSSSHARLPEDSHFGAFLRDNGISGKQLQYYLENVPLYWGDQPFTSGPFYVGASMVLLFVLGLWLLEPRYRWWFLLASALAIMLSWGRHWAWFSDLFFHYFPGYNRFRTVSMILTIVQFLVPLGALLVVSHIVSHQGDAARIRRKVLHSFALVGGICLFFALLGPGLFAFTGEGDAAKRMQPAIQEVLIADRKDMLRMDALRSFLMVGLMTASLWFFLQGRLSRPAFMAAVVMIAFADMFFVARRYLSESNFVDKQTYEQHFEANAADEFIQRDTTGIFRVFNLAGDPWNDSRTSYIHYSVGGYHAAKLRRYQDLIEQQLSGKSENRPYPFNKAVVDMLNTRYFIVKGNQPVVPNAQALGNAWFVDSVQWVQNADEEMAALNDFNPRTTALVDVRFAHEVKSFSLEKDPSAFISLVSYQPNHLVYEYQHAHGGVAVFSEIYYQPGWNAYVDGQLASHFRCNYILRGMQLPAGRHRLEFRFEPTSYYWGERVAMASSLVLLLLTVGWAARAFRTRHRLNEKR